MWKTSWTVVTQLEQKLRVATTVLSDLFTILHTSHIKGCRRIKGGLFVLVLKILAQPFTAQ